MSRILNSTWLFNVRYSCLNLTVSCAHEVKLSSYAEQLINQCHTVKIPKNCSYSIESKKNTSTVTFQARVGTGLLWNFMGWFSNAWEMYWLYWLTNLCNPLPLLTHELIKALILLYIYDYMTARRGGIYNVLWPNSEARSNTYFLYVFRFQISKHSGYICLAYG